MPFPFPVHVDSPARAPPSHPRLHNTAFSGLGLPTWPPVASPSNNHGRARLHLRQSYYDESVNALSFGFLTTAILVSMFVIIAIFERFLRPTEHPRVDPCDIEGGKPSCFPSPKMKTYDKGVSVLMPGDEVPSFIAHHAPLSRRPERHPQPKYASANVPAGTSYLELVPDPEPCAPNSISIHV